jgi:hypothetical protein
MIETSMGHLQNDYDVKIELLGEKPTAGPLFPPQTPHDMNWDRINICVVTGRRLTGSAMVRPQTTYNKQQYITGDY